MKAVVIEGPGSIEKSRYTEVDKPSGGVIVRVTHAGLNPIDINVIKGKTNYRIHPYPHIPGAEFVGIVDDPGKSRKFKKDDRVAVFPRVFDGTCDRCRMGMEEICRNGGVMSVSGNGGYSEYFGTDEEHLEMVPDELEMEDAVSIPVGGLTSYHALRRAGLKRGERVLVVGASGNTGIYAVLLSKISGAEVYHISRKTWVNKSGSTSWDSQKVDVIVNSLGSEFWNRYWEYLDTNGRMVTFGTMTGTESELNIASLYTGERSIMGSTGGTKKEFTELLNLVAEKKLKSRIWRKYPLEDYRKAIDDYENKDGRIIFEVS